MTGLLRAAAWAPNLLGEIPAVAMLLASHPPSLSPGAGAMLGELTSSPKPSLKRFYNQRTGATIYCKLLPPMEEVTTITLTLLAGLPIISSLL